MHRTEEQSCGMRLETWGDGLRDHAEEGSKNILLRENRYIQVDDERKSCITARSKQYPYGHELRRLQVDFEF